jgi:hypothetical protein
MIRLPKAQLISEADAAVQPRPYITVGNFTPVQLQTVLAQASKVCSPYNRYDARGAQGSLGKYQFSAPHLQLLGYLKLGTVEALAGQDDDNALAIETEAAWTGLGQCNRATDFLNNTGEQEVAIQSLWQWNSQWLAQHTIFFSGLSTDQQAGILLVAQVTDIVATIKFYDFLMGRNDSGNSVDQLGNSLMAYFNAGIAASNFGFQLNLA